MDAILTHMAYEIIAVNGTPTLVPNDLACENVVCMYKLQLRDIAHRCKNISTADLSRIPDSDVLSIIHINARSLKQNLDDIVTFVDAQKYMIDFILITETRLDPALAQG